MFIQNVDNTPSTNAVLALARAERHRTTATVSSLLLAAHVLETLGDTFDQAAAIGINDALKRQPATATPTKAQQLATTMAAGGNSGRMAQHFREMNARAHPGMIRRFLGAIGIGCCVIGTAHMSMDLGARVSADVQRASIEYCGQC